MRKLVLLLLLLMYLSRIDGLSCHCQGDCGGEDTCTAESSLAYCVIDIQISNSVEHVFQYCSTGGFALGCNGELRVNIGSIRPYSMCCRTLLCNSEETLLDLIEEYNSQLPSQSQSQSHNSTNGLTSSTQIYNSTSATQVITATSSFTSSSSTVASSSYSSNVTGSSSLSTVSSSSYIATIIVSTHTSSFVSYSTTHIVNSVSSSSTMQPVSTAQPASNISPPSYAIAVITILTFLLGVFIVIIVIVVFLHFYPRHIVGMAIPDSDSTPTCTLSTECDDFSGDQVLHVDGTTSGSGSGLPLLIQRSIATQVTLHELVGKGRFGEVRRGSYKGDDVAVKIFHSKEEVSWFHEVNIYQTCLIRHPNILRFIAADNKDIGIATQLWLITEFCDYGSLYEMLQTQQLDESVVLKLCYTAASGLAHLHSEITGTEGKPAIAHRDIKSRNILVKADYSCCLADLGLALRYHRDTDTVEEPPTKRVGTRRYLAPEILDDSMNAKNFDSFKRADMYSFGLVIWEIARRGLCTGHAEEYQLPYFDLVTPDPPFDEMKRVVAIEKKRPAFPNRWSQRETFHSLSQIMDQCWHHNGEARLTALRVKKNLFNLQSTKEKLKDTIQA